MKKYLVLIGALSFFATSCDVPTSNNSCLLASFLNSPTSGMAMGIGYKTLGGSSIAQPFIPNSNGVATSVGLFLQKVGGFSPNTQSIVATIETNSISGTNVTEPDRKPIAFTDPYDVSAITATGSVVSLKLKDSVPISHSQVYWIRVKASYSVNDANYINWAAFDGKTGGYSVNSTKLNAGYETSEGNFSTSSIGTNRYLIFQVGC